jgi:hypothetical protein
VLTRQKDPSDAGSTGRATKSAREFKRQIDDLSETIADLTAAVRDLRTTTGEETLDVRSRIHEFDRRLARLERSVAQHEAKPEAKTNSK